MKYDLSNVEITVNPNVFVQGMNSMKRKQFFDVELTWGSLRTCITFRMDEHFGFVHMTGNTGQFCNGLDLVIAIQNLIESLKW